MEHNKKSKQMYLGVDQLQPGPYQSRVDFSGLAELAESIKNSEGNDQAILAVPAGNGMYNILAGERRWRASQMAGLHEVKVDVYFDLTEREASVKAITENVHRKDLNLIETARGYLDHKEIYGLTDAELAAELGKPRSTVTIIMNILKLPEDVQNLLIEGRRGDKCGLEIGHAKLLLTLEPFQQRAFGLKAAANKWSTDRLSKEIKKMKLSMSGGVETPKGISADAKEHVDRLEKYFGTPITIDNKKGGRGEIRIKYHSLEELEGVLEKMNVPEFL